MWYDSSWAKWGRVFWKIKFTKYNMPHRYGKRFYFVLLDIAVALFSIYRELCGASNHILQYCFIATASVVTL